MRIASLVMMIFFLAGCAIAPCSKGKDNYQVDSFVKMQTFFDDDLVSSGSGSVVDQRDGFTVILTAAHVCYSFELSLLSLVMEKELTVKAHGHEATVISLDTENDICLMRVDSGLEDKPALRLSKRSPEIGETFYNMASPIGIANIQTGMLALFSGAYMGYTKFGEASKDMFSIPSAGGSSGSPIVNSRGELVGIITHRLNGFEHMAISPRYENFHNFVSSNLEKVRTE